MIQNTQIYRVKVTNPSLNDNFRDTTNMNEDEIVKCQGFLDNKEVAEYDDFNILEQPLAGETLEDFQNKSRGLIRFRQMCLNLQRGLDDMVEVKTNLDKEYEKDHDDPLYQKSHILTPEWMEFKLIYTQPDGLTVEIRKDEFLEEAIEQDPEIFKTRDGRVFLKGSRAIKRLIAKTLVDDYNMFAEYFDNTSTPSGNPSNWKILPLEVKGPCDSIEKAEFCVEVDMIVEAKPAMHAEKRLVKTEE